MKKKLKNSYLIPMIITSIVFAFFASFVDFELKSFLVKLLMYLILVPVGFYAFIKIKKLLSQVEPITNAYSYIENLCYGLTDIKIFLLFWVVLIIGYMPAFFALFPGTFGYDAPLQIAQYFGDSELTLQHPIAHTYFMGICLSIGNLVFNSYNIGFAIYTILQALIVTACIAYSFLFCKRCNVSIIWIFLGMLWLIKNPFLQLLLFSSTKDVLFGAFSLGLVVSLGDILFFDNRTKYVNLRLIVFGVLFCLFRNQGIYILIVLLPCFLLFRIWNKKIYLCVIVSIIITYLFQGVCTTVFHIPEGNKREMLSVPMQQMAYVALEYPESLTEEQMSTLLEIIPLEGIKAYDPSKADSVKDTFMTEMLFKDFGKHLRNYIDIGLQNPSKYVQAWKWLIHWYWDTSENTVKGLTISYTFPQMNRWEIKHSNLFPAYYQRLTAVAQSSDLLLYERTEICLWVMVILSVVAATKRNRKLMLLMMPLVLYFGTTLLGPVALIRYLYPLSISTPLLFSMLFAKAIDK
ncbi:MAG: hypothetical protein IJ379_02545 [Lachnospiraceae bacterium]|nr:hypothetical protein [Lachnospiraceae bacterium]